MSQNIAIIGNSAVTLVGFRLDLIKQLVQQGYNVYAFSPLFTEPLREQVRMAGGTPVHFEISRSGMNPLSELGVVRSLSKLLTLHNIDTSLTYFIKPVIYGTIAAKIAGVKNINGMIAGLGYAFTNDMTGSVEPKRLIIKKIIERLFKFTLRWNRKVFFQNPDDLQHFVHHKLIDPAKTVVIEGSGVNLDEYEHSQAVEQPAIFITSGRLVKEKGFEEFIGAANILKNKYRDSRFIILGGTDENPNTLDSAHVQTFVDSGIIEWPGLVDNVADWLSRSSVFVLPSYYREGTPRSILEALSIGRPVVTTNLPGCRETVIEGVNGFFVPPRDPKKLAEVMERFILNPELIRSMGVESRRLAEEKFDVRKVNRKMMEEMGLLSDESMISA